MRCARALLPLVALLVSAGATVAQGQCRAEGPDWPPAGSRWTMRQVRTGSFGAGKATVVVELVGARRWKGVDAVALREGALVTYLDGAHRLLARVRGGVTLSAFEPYDAILAWPLFVGRSWGGEYVAREPGGPAAIVIATYRVEAYEELRLPAGIFPAFRIVRDDLLERTVRWWSAELGISLRVRVERSGLHRRGAGTYEEELVSYAFLADRDP